MQDAENNGLQIMLSNQGNNGFPFILVFPNFFFFFFRLKSGLELTENCIPNLKTSTSLDSFRKGINIV